MNKLNIILIILSFFNIQSAEIDNQKNDNNNDFEKIENFIISDKNINWFIIKIENEPKEYHKNFISIEKYIFGELDLKWGKNGSLIIRIGHIDFEPIHIQEVFIFENLIIIKCIDKTNKLLICTIDKINHTWTASNH